MPISCEDFAEQFKEGITNDLRDSIATLETVAQNFQEPLRSQIEDIIAKLAKARQICCDVPPPCTGGDARSS